MQWRQKNKLTLDFFNVKWNVEFKCLLTFFGQLAPLRVMPKTGTAPKPERLSRRAKHDAAVTPHLKTSLLRKPNRGLGWQSSSNCRRRQPREKKKCNRARGVSEEDKVEG